MVAIQLLVIQAQNILEALLHKTLILEEILDIFVVDQWLTSGIFLLQLIALVAILGIINLCKEIYLVCSKILNKFS